jgi:hypothetical protein
MNKETLRMQMLAGVITEGQYKEKLQENFFKNLIDKVRKKEEPIEPEKAKSELDGLTDEQALALYNEYNKQAGSIDPYDPHIGGYAQVYQTLASKLKTMYPNAIKESLNEHYVAGGFVGIGAINQIPATPKTDYEMAFEHFLGQKYSINEAEANIDPAIKNNPAFDKLVSYLKTNPDEAEELKDKEDEIEDVLQNVNEAFKKDGKFYTQDTYGNTKEVDFKTYLKNKGISVAMSAAALGFLGALMAGALGTNTPNEIIDAVLVASGVGAAAGAALGEGEVEEENNY